MAQKAIESDRNTKDNRVWFVVGVDETGNPIHHVHYLK